MSAPESDRLKSIAARITAEARRSAQDPNRIRRQLAFQRLIARLAGTGWVLKGGYCLEVRLASQARTTKDMDLVRREAVADGDALLDELEAVLAGVHADDGFSFDPVKATILRAPDDPHAAWRVSVECRVDGRHFTALHLDLVTQFDEVADAVEELVVNSPVPSLGYAPVVVPAVDVYQHAAEKFHAMGRLYAGDRPSSRVKDLVDLVLLTEAGLLVDLSALRDRIVAVHRYRDGTAPPDELARPPRDWVPRYGHMVADLDMELDTLDAAFDRIQDLYRTALAAQD